MGLNNIFNIKAMENLIIILPPTIYIIFRLYPTLISKNLKQTKQEYINKVRTYEDLGLLFFYILHCIFAYILFIKPKHLKEWIIDDHMIGNLILDQDTFNSAKVFYTWQLLFYISLIIIIWVPPIKKDVKIMLMHHLITIILTYTGWTCTYYRLVIIVLIIHDACDVLLQISRLFYKFKFEKISTLIFALFYVSHCILRVCVFPFISFYGIIHTETITSQFQRLFPLCLMTTLWMLHIYWAILMTRMIYKKVYLKQGPSEMDEVKNNC